MINGWSARYHGNEGKDSENFRTRVEQGVTCLEMRSSVQLMNFELVEVEPAREV